MISIGIKYYCHMPFKISTKNNYNDDAFLDRWM